MTHAVVRGKPSQAQLYIENIIQELVKETGRQDDRHSISRIMYKTLRDNPDALYMIEGISGEELKNGELLKKAVKAATALERCGVKKGDLIYITCWNTIDLAVLYFGCLFAGVVMLCMEDFVTQYEIEYYMNIVEPKLFFAEQSKVEVVTAAIRSKNINCPLIILNDTMFTKFIDVDTEHIDKYWPVENSPEDTVILFVTSGSTGGLPKIAVASHKGLVSQIGSQWNFESSPKNGLVLALHSAQWSVHTMHFTQNAIFGIPILTQSVRIIPETLLSVIRKYKPTEVHDVTPTEITDLINCKEYRTGDLYSFKNILAIGSPLTKELTSRVKRELKDDTSFMNGYGMTEVLHFICIGNKNTILPSVGWVANIFNYKLVDDEGNEVTKPNTPGELCVKSDYCIIKRYLNIDTPLCDEEGFFHTGDIFYRNIKDEMFFVDRKKFIIFYKCFPISPKEIEDVVCSIEGVSLCSVCESERGPAALVVLQRGARTTRDNIQGILREKLSEYKQLVGGIAFVESLPKSSRGKILKVKCKELIEDLIKKNECY